MIAGAPIAAFDSIKYHAGAECQYEQLGVQHVPLPHRTMAELQRLVWQSLKPTNGTSVISTRCHGTDGNLGEDGYGCVRIVGTVWQALHAGLES